MKQIVIFAGLIAISLAQPLDQLDVTPTPWKGPFANHKNGILPEDTPEVAQAKASLDHAYSLILAVLPELPPEQRYQPGPALVPHIPEVIAHAPGYIHHVTVPQHIPVSQNVLIPQSTIFHPVTLSAVVNVVAPIPTPRTFAEDVPRSPTGETPEVYAARLAHLKALEEAGAKFPRQLNH